MGLANRRATMLTEQQINQMAEWLGEELNDDPDMYVDAIDGTRDAIDNYDGRAWNECSSVERETLPSGVDVVVCEGVQVARGQQRLTVYVMDFGDVRGVYQQ